MEKYKEVFELSYLDMLNFCRKHYILLTSTVVAGVGAVALRRYFAGGVCRSTVQLQGKTVLITGANTGIGKETARDLAKRGARVILACRDITKAERAAEEIIKESQNNQVCVKVVDLSNLASVRKFCDEFNAKEERLDILINNAGVMACPKWTTTDGFEYQIGTNHFGHFLLTNLLLDKLKSSAPSRVVVVSSLAEKRGTIDLEDINFEHKEYDPWKAYGQSKLANVLFAREFTKKYKADGVTAYSLHPGVVRTELGRYMTSAGIPQWRLQMFRVLFYFVMKTPTEGAQTTLHCALEEGLEEHAGKFFSDCAVKKPSANGEDDDMAAKLWDLSETAVNSKK